MDLTNFLKNHELLSKKYSLNHSMTLEDSVVESEKEKPFKENAQNHQEICNKASGQLRRDYPRETETETETKDVADNCISNLCHILYLDTDAGAESVDLPFAYLLSVYTAYMINKPDKIYLYHNRNLFGRNFDMLRKEIPENILQIRFVSSPMLNRLNILKFSLSVLNAYGGVLFDIGILSVRPLKHLLNQSFVLGKQFSLRIRKLNQPDGTYKVRGSAEIGTICPDFMMGIKNATFAEFWENEIEKHKELLDVPGEQYNEDQKEVENELLNVIPYKLCLKHKNAVTLIEPDMCFLPAYFEPKKIFEEKTNIIPTNMLFLNLWRAHNRDKIMNITDWSWATENKHCLLGKILNKVNPQKENEMFIVSNFSFTQGERDNPSPFSDILIKSDTFVKLLQNVDFYLQTTPVPVEYTKDFQDYKDGHVCLLKDIEIYFPNVHNLQQSIDNFMDKSQALLRSRNRIYVLVDDEKFTADVSRRFQSLDFEHKKLIVSQSNRQYINHTDLVETHLSNHTNNENVSQLLRMVTF